MKPDLQFSLLCEDVRQERSGAFCFIGVTGMLRASKFPQRYHQLFIVNGWCKGADKHTQQIKIIYRVNDQRIFGSDGIPFQLKDLTDKRVIITQFQNVVFPGAGEYSVEILLDGELKLAYPLIVQKIKLREVPSPGEPPKTS